MPPTEPDHLAEQLRYEAFWLSEDDDPDTLRVTSQRLNAAADRIEELEAAAAEAVRPQGVWVAYMWDWNPILIGAYPTEVEALRAANENSGEVRFLRWGLRLDDPDDLPLVPIERNPTKEATDAN